MRLAFAPLLLLLSACATMGASDPTAGLEDADITRRTLDGGDVVEEYRIAGQLRVVKVVPLSGPTYYLVDSNGDGTLDSSEGEGPISPVQYKLFEW